MIQLEAVRVALETGTVYRADETTQLTPQERMLFTFFAANPLQNLSRERLLSGAWGYAPSVRSRAVDTTVARLRVLLEADPKQPRHLLTVFGTGYRYVPLQSAPRASFIEMGGCTVDVGLQQVRWRDGRTLSLSTREVTLLEVLADRRGQVVTRAELMRWVWNDRSGRATRAVDNAVMRLRARLEADPKQPRFLKTVRGAGYRLEQERPAAPAPRQRPAGLFLGREEEQARLSAELKEPGLVTLLGPGGIGKTSLALRLSDDAIFCDLSAVTDEDGVLQVMMAALSMPRLPAGVVPAARAIAGSLAERGGALLILDNAEQITAAMVALLPIWLAGAPRLRILVTSRRRLALPEERVQHLGPLSSKAGAALFLARFSAAGGVVSPPDAPVVAELVARLDGLPLAIGLAAARGRLMSPSALLARLDQRLSLLRRVGPTDNPRHATLRAAIDWSWALLSEVEQAALSWCGVFVSGFGLEAAEAVLAEILPPTDWALDVLGALQDHSLLVPVADALPGEVRLKMLESIRVFALEKLRERGEQAGAEAAHAAYFAQLAEGLLTDELLVGAPTVLKRLALDFDNFRTAASRSGRVEHAGWCLAASAPAMLRAGAGAEVCQRLPGMRAALPPVLAVRLLREVGLARLNEGNVQAAQATLMEAVTIDGPGVMLHRAVALGSLGSTHEAARDWATAAETFAGGARLAGELGAYGLQAMLLAYQATNTYYGLGQEEEGLRLLAGAKLLLARPGFPMKRAFVHHNIAMFDLECGRYGSTIFHLRAAVALMETLGEHIDAQLFSCQLALALRLDGDGAASDAVLDAFTLPASQMAGYRRLVFLVVQGQIHAIAGRWERAEALLREGLNQPIARQHGDQIFSWLALCCAVAGRRQDVEDALTLSQDSRVPNIGFLVELTELLCSILLSESPAVRQSQVARARSRLSVLSERRAENGIRLIEHRFEYRYLFALLQRTVDTSRDTGATGR